MKQLSDELYSQVRALINMMANTCRRCNRDKSICPDCDLRESVPTLRRMDTERGETVEERRGLGLLPRYIAILRAVRDAGGEAIARDLEVSREMDCVRKAVALRNLRKSGLLTARRNDFGFLVYAINPAKSGVVDELVK